jgi:integrase
MYVWRQVEMTDFYALCRRRAGADGTAAVDRVGLASDAHVCSAARAAVDTPHDCRRFVGTELARRNLRQTQRALGHQHLETTVAHYVRDAL